MTPVPCPRWPPKLSPRKEFKVTRPYRTRRVISNGASPTSMSSTVISGNRLSKSRVTCAVPAPVTTGAASETVFSRRPVSAPAKRGKPYEEKMEQQLQVHPETTIATAAYRSLPSSCFCLSFLKLFIFFDDD